MLTTRGVESAQNRQINSHDKRVKSRNFSVGDMTYVRNYGQGPKWVKGTIADTSGAYNFLVEVMLSGQLMRWKRHVDQLRNCYDTTGHGDSTADSTPSVSPQEEEEEKEDSSEIVVYGNCPSVPVEPNSVIVVPRRNPPRNRRPPDKLTY